jgi:phenylpropionate dioxygenase-like ring-hydroxylating dioxygenase large terminal subunit
MIWFGLKQQWMPLCLEKKISTKPKRLFVLGHPLVIYRIKNQIIALLDRCPHRGFPLSQGKIQGDLLQCQYHGWSFDAKGQCISIPGLVNKTNIKDKCVTAFQTQVKYGLVFVCLEPQETTLPVYDIPALQNKNYHFYSMEFNIKGEILNIIENALDATHTHYVHAGLLRHESKRQMISATLTTNALSAEVCYEGEQKQSGLISTLFESSRKTSIGRFHSPLIAELEYYGHKGLNAAFSFFLSPINDKEHRAFLLISYRNHWFTGPLKKIFFYPFIKAALKQDITILGKLNLNDTFFPNAPIKSTELDILRPHIQRILEGKGDIYKKTIQMEI